MALILSLETSGRYCSVALHDRGELLEVIEVHEPQSHAAKLAILVADVFKKTNAAIHDLDAVAVSSGPGSYTGLRIGTSLAKGICYTLNTPLIAVKTLHLLAHQAQDENKFNGLLCPMIDAKRMEVYCEVMDSDLNIVEPVAAKVVEEGAFTELLQHHKMFFFGDGAEKCKKVIGHANAYFRENVFPSASGLGKIAYSRFLKKDFEDLKVFSPFYLKDFVAKKARSVF